jgi:hypothetical protein
VVRIFSFGTQLAYTLTSLAIAASPSVVCSPPISTRDGKSKSCMAVPSAKNSGLLRTWNLCAEADARTRLILSAVRTGTVLFSTTILSFSATSAILRAQSSQFLIFAARPAPMPEVFVGVFTDTKIISASRMAESISVEKNRFLGMARNDSKPNCRCRHHVQCLLLPDRLYNLL